MEQRQRSPWRILAIVVAIAVPALLVTGAIVGMVEDAIEAQRASELALASSPSAETVDACNRYASLADLGMAGAAQGELTAPDAAGDVATDATAAPDERRAVGVGTSVGLNEQNKQSPLARAAYRDCMARKGYAS